MEQQNINFKSILIKLASPEKILSWSHGEVTKPETINYRSQRPERDGLFDEKIFGPTKDYECYCGKYRKIRYKGIICDKCGVEVTKSVVRRERMGHIELAVPVTHIWFLRSIPSRMGLVLNISINDLEKVIYYSGYIITHIDEAKKEEMIKELEKEFKNKLKGIESKTEISALKDLADKTKKELKFLKLYQIINEAEYHKFSLKYGEVFEAGIGAEALYKIFKNLNLEELKENILNELVSDSADIQQKKKIINRLNILNSFIQENIKPEWMFLKIIPVIPPDLRPIVPLDGGRHAASDVNDLYRRVINRNNRLKRLIELKAPEVMQRNEKRMLQEAVDALLDNSLRHTQELNSQRRPLKSLADMLKGKQGRFRQNLLGKRVDYSGRSVIVVGPELKMNQVGLPKHLVLELFRPFVIQKLLEYGDAFNVKGANRLIDEPSPKIWAILEEVIKDKHVLLNRAPTLHRLGIQAFKPILIEGNAIQIHPLVCSAFNADFDGDQMAVHVPLSNEAQEEAKNLMASSKNLLKPGTGEPIISPSQDVIAGCYWLTKIKNGAKGENRYFSSPNEVVTAYEFNIIDLHAKIKIKTTRTPKYESLPSENGIAETTAGRIMFNSVLPSNFNFINKEVGKKVLSKIVVEIIENYDKEIVPSILDRIKNFGFKFATMSGMSWGIDDLKTPLEKSRIVSEAEKEAAKIKEDFEKGLLNDTERYNKIIKVWMEVKNKISDLIPATLEEFGPVNLMTTSAARGGWDQVAQMTGMVGMVTNPAGRIIELPIIANYKEGFNPLEYFISTHGARKGTADTALKTSAAGYLTRRLVDVAYDIILEDDCKTEEFLIIFRNEIEEYCKSFSARIFGRVLSKDIKNKSGKVLFKKNHLLSLRDAENIEQNIEIENVSIRSPLYCKTTWGLCKMCYGYDLGNNSLIKSGEAVGVIAAQSIGEPGTQLTMRTFHTGGVAGAGGDITLGLPRVEELFEARIPGNPAVLSDIYGEVMKIETEKGEQKVSILLDKDKNNLKAEEETELKKKRQKNNQAKKDTKEFVIPFGRIIMVKPGDKISPGDALSDGPYDIKKLFLLTNREKAQDYIIKEVSKVYFLQGVTVNLKHIEIIVRQMFSRIKIKNSHGTKLMMGKIVDAIELDEENKLAEISGLEPAEGVNILMGLTKVALTTSSVLSAASFQDTTRVLVDASIKAKKDKLRGLKENVIIGRLIPAGTNFRKEFEKKPTGI